ncbi:hypothetical protein [Lentzea sp. NBRC 102530]|uniref:hypothetical protein n=1 Tax=Lentzea sp. NBRC 102530 TaxID=3032201 RepID=UPI0024A417ED|nr:hypothetical protein [Lentzea sp. NBRC 102530]GLY53954.1 hypothetical protein Lesp01_76100 [Lentzea sp. NBRC 102530]
MTAGARPGVVPLAECADVWDILDQVRSRPSMWIRGRRLRELEMTLQGYGVALEVHGIDESFHLTPGGPFGQWLHARFAWGMSCGWAQAITENAGTEDPLDLFFRLVDEYRASDQQSGSGQA